MMLNDQDTEFATNTYLLPLSYATAWGSEPTGIVATTAFVESEITVTYEPPFAKSPFATNRSPFPLSYATAPTAVPATTAAATSVVAAELTPTFLAHRFPTHPPPFPPSDATT